MNFKVGDKVKFTEEHIQRAFLSDETREIAAAFIFKVVSNPKEYNDGIEGFPYLQIIAYHVNFAHMAKEYCSRVHQEDPKDLILIEDVRAVREEEDNRFDLDLD